jgi:hypothetical protein
VKWINGWSATTTFEGEFSDVTSSYAGKGVGATRSDDRAAAVNAKAGSAVPTV